jgi:hypothetical protein
MALRNTKITLHGIVAIPVAFIVLGAFALSIAAVIENLHFINATNQILSIVSTVRSLTAGQSSFAQTPGEDIWAALEHSGQIISSPSHPNPWHGEMRIITISNSAMRIESDLPTHDCRRLALYFLQHQPTDLGLVTIEAQSFTDALWTPIYPGLTADEHITQQACGKPPYSRLALIFKIR